MANYQEPCGVRYENICPIVSITNANWRYWADKQMYKFMDVGDDYWFDDRKKYLKKGFLKLWLTRRNYSTDVFIVWARRFAGYKRAGLLTTEMRKGFSS